MIHHLLLLLVWFPSNLPLFVILNSIEVPPSSQMVGADTMSIIHYN